jgi:hypothetical protein
VRQSVEELPARILDEIPWLDLVIDPHEPELLVRATLAAFICNPDALRERYCSCQPRPQVVSHAPLV